MDLSEATSDEARLVLDDVAVCVALALEHPLGGDGATSVGQGGLDPGVLAVELLDLTAHGCTPVVGIWTAHCLRDGDRFHVTGIIT